MKKRVKKPLKPRIPLSKSSSPNKVDPTGTTSIRRAMMGIIKRKFSKLKGKIITLIGKEDALGLNGVLSPTGLQSSNLSLSSLSTIFPSEVVGNAEEVDEQGGRWVTTKTGKHVYIDSSGAVHYGREGVTGTPSATLSTTKGVSTSQKEVVAEHPKLSPSKTPVLGVTKGWNTPQEFAKEVSRVTGEPVVDKFTYKLGPAGSIGTEVQIPSYIHQEFDNAGKKDPKKWTTKEVDAVRTVAHEILHSAANKEDGWINQEEKKEYSVVDKEVPSAADSNKKVKSGVRLFLDEAANEVMARHAVGELRGKSLSLTKDEGAYQQYVIGLHDLAKVAKVQPHEYAAKLRRLSTRDQLLDIGRVLGAKSQKDALIRGHRYSTEVLAAGNDYPVRKKSFSDVIQLLQSNREKVSNTFCTVEDWLKESNLSPYQESIYRKAFHTVIEGMPESSKIVFNVNSDIDSDILDSTHLLESTQLLPHVYAYKLGHIIDREHLLSNSREWREAYSSEIKSPGDPLSKTASKSPAEGFAEYARLLFLHPDKAKDKQFSKCYNAWKRHGLLEDTKMTVNTLYAVDPSNTFNVLVYNGVSGIGHWVTLEGGQHVYISGEGELLIGKDRISKHLLEHPEEQSTVKGEQHERTGTERGRGEGSEGGTRPSEATDSQVATEAQGPNTTGTDKNGRTGTQPAGAEPTQGISSEEIGGVSGAKKEEEHPVTEEARQQAAGLEEVNKRLDRYADLFRKKGLDEQANWMEQLRDHINEVGTQQALEGLGIPIPGLGAREGGEQVQYGGHSEIGHFVEQYLDRHGISLIQGGQFDPSKRVVSTVAPSSDEGGVPLRGKEGDIYPTLQGLRDKLHESQNLPGLEKSEDIGKLMGKEFGSRIDNFTPEVVAKLDEQYGKGQWIVKSYGDEAYAGYGIFFPQRTEQVKKDAQDTIWNAGEHLGKYGFRLARDHEGKVAGLIHETGDVYPFGKVEHGFDENGKLYTHIEGTPEYHETIHGDARKWADAAAVASLSEHGATIPPGKFMAQPAFPVVGISNEERAAGVTFKTGQEGRVHIATKDGVASVVPHSTWLKGEHLPVVFESEDTRAMAKAAVDAINNLPISERRGQLYAPDIVKTKDGYRAVEANPANEAGASGYLQDNPMIIDSYVSHTVGREPSHVAFVRKLLTDRRVNRDTEQGINPPTTTGEGRERSSQGGIPGLTETQSSRASRVHTQEPGVPQTPLSAKQRLTDKVPELSEGKGGVDKDQRWDHPPEVQAAHNEAVLKAAKESGLFVPSRHFSGITSTPNVGGNEHDVHEDTKNDKFYKFTKGGHFGQNKDVHEYLERHDIANKLWPELGYKVHGITESPFDGTPQVVTSMNRIEGTHPSTGEIEHWFRSNGWHPNDERWSWEDGSDAGHWSWKDPHSGTIINDAHSKNFIKTKSGKLAPIDVDILPGKK